MSIFDFFLLFFCISQLRLNECFVLTCIRHIASHSQMLYNPVWDKYLLNIMKSDSNSLLKEIIEIGFFRERIKEIHFDFSRNLI